MIRTLSTMIILALVVLVGLARAPARTGASGPASPVVSTPTPTATPTIKTITVPRAGARPVVDGYLAEWQTLGQTLLNKDTASTVEGQVPSHADLSAGLRGAWAPEALYFAAAITDDVLVGNDSPQIGGMTASSSSIRVGGTTHQFTVAVDGRQADRGSPITSLTVATRTVPGGWTLEVAVPAAALGLTQLAAGGQYPFTFGLWDDDLRTYPGQTHMIWQGSDTYSYQPDWGILDLSSTVYDFAHIVNAPRAGALPTLDGDLSEWQALPATLLDRTDASSIAGSETNPTPADLSAGLRAAWAPDRLYFAAAITDEVLVGNDSPQIGGMTASS